MIDELTLLRKIQKAAVALVDVLSDDNPSEWWWYSEYVDLVSALNISEEEWLIADQKKVSQ